MYPSVDVCYSSKQKLLNEFATQIVLIRCIVFIPGNAITVIEQFSSAIWFTFAFYAITVEFFECLFLLCLRVYASKLFITLF